MLYPFKNSECVSGVVYRLDRIAQAEEIQEACRGRHGFPVLAEEILAEKGSERMTEAPQPFATSELMGIFFYRPENAHGDKTASQQRT